jgi:CRISPR-associated protein (TIGR02584 family)
MLHLMKPKRQHKTRPGMRARGAPRQPLATVSSPPSPRAGTPPDPRAPHSYPRRILLAVTGLSPQVVTETLYALAVSPGKDRPAFVPTEIHLITTGQGAEHARLNLLSENPGWFHRLCREYALPPMRLDDSTLHVVTDAAGAALEDIRTPADNEQVADCVAAVVRELTADTSSALHVSLAGGRKTMGYYLGYALSLYGRPQDRLSHVLVSAPFESHPEFYYPSREQRVIHTREPKPRPLDCREARVDLAEIPFVRLRDGQPRRLLEGRASFSAVVAAAARAQAQPELVLDRRQLKVWADGEAIDVTPTEFVLLLWFAERARRGVPVIDWSRPEAADEFIAQARRVFKEMSGDLERIEEVVAERRNLAIKLSRYFEPHKSRLNSAFKDALRVRAGRYQIEHLIEKEGKNKFIRFRLPLAPEEIEIKD